MNIDSTIKKWRWWVMLPVIAVILVLMSPQILTHLLMAILGKFDEALDRFYSFIPMAKIRRWIHRD